MPSALEILEGMAPPAGPAQAPPTALGILEQLAPTAPKPELPPQAAQIQELTGREMGRGILAGMGPETTRGPAPSRIVQLPPELEPMRDFVNGFNRELIDSLGAPADAVNEFLRLVGTGMPEGEDPSQWIAAAAEAAGIESRKLDTVYAKMGRGTADALIITAGLFVAAPVMAANTSMTIGGYLSRAFADLVQQYPAIATLTEVSGSVGAETGAHVMKGSPLSETIGAFVGGIGGAATFGMTTAGLRTAAQRALRPAGEAAVGTPLRAPDISSWVFRQAAKERIQDLRLQFDAQIRQFIKKVPMVDTSGNISVRFRKALEGARTKMTAEESALWEGLPQKAGRAHTASSSRQLDEILEKTTVESDAYPSGLDKRIRRWAPVEGGKEATFEQLHQLRSDALDGARVARSAGHRGLARNYDQMASALLDDMEGAALAGGAPPDAVAIAREFSAYRTGLFDKGPVGEVLAVRRTGEPRVPIKETIKRLQAKFGGFEAAERIALEREAPQIQTQLSEYIQSRFGEAAAAAEQAKAGLGRPVETEASRAAAVAFVDKNKDVIERLGRAGLELRLTAKRLQKLRAQQLELDRSTLARTLTMGGEEAVTPEAIASRIYDSPNPAKAASELASVAQLDSSGRAMASLKNILLDALWRRSGATVSQMEGILKTPGMRATVSPQRVYHELSKPHMREGLEAVLSPEEMARLERYVTTAVQVERGDVGVARKVAQKIPPILARFFGAQLGRRAAAVTGGGTVQSPQITSNVAKDIVEWALGGPNAGELMTATILDPKTFAVLQKKLPTTPGEIQRLTIQMRRVFGTLSAGEAYVKRRVEEEGGR